MEKILIGTIGVILGSILTLLRETWADHRNRKKKAEYLAIRVVCILDRFVDGCVSVTLDEGERDEQHCLRTSTSTPKLNFEKLDVDWQSLSSDLMYEILNFPSDLEDADGKIDSVAEYVAFPPDYEDAFEERQFQYSNLGLKAHKLSSNLREKYDLPVKSYKNWNPIECMEKSKEAITSIRIAREKDHEKMSKIA